jgi:hypothetical protein
LIQEDLAAHLKIIDASLGSTAECDGGRSHSIASSPSPLIAVVSVSAISGIGSHETDIASTPSGAAASIREDQQRFVRPSPSQSNIALIIENDPAGKVICPRVQEHHLARRTVGYGRRNLSSSCSGVQRGTHGRAIGNSSHHTGLAPVGRSSWADNTGPRLSAQTASKAKE